MIFRTLKYSENSIICDVFTESHGLRSFIVSSSKNNRSMTNLMQVMNLVDIVFYEKNAEQIQRIKECHLHHFYQKISSDIIRSSIGTFMLELSRNTIREHEAQPDLFEFLMQWFVGLDEREGGLQYYHLSFMLALTQWSGFYPHTNYVEGKQTFFDMLSGSFVPVVFDARHVLIEQESMLLYKLLFQNESGQGIRGFNLAERNALMDMLLKYYQLHIPGFKPLKSLEIIRQVIQ